MCVVVIKPFVKLCKYIEIHAASESVERADHKSAFFFFSYTRC